MSPPDSGQAQAVPAPSRKDPQPPTGNRQRPRLGSVLKLSSPPTHEFWEIPVLFEDDHLLALDKPAGLLTSPDRGDPQRPSLMQLLHAGIAAGKPWVRERGLSYLMNAHRLDSETSGVLLLARSRPALVALANLFGAGRVKREYVALVKGATDVKRLEINAKLAPHPARPGLTRVEPRQGKQAQTIVAAQEQFAGYTLLRCEPVTERPSQIRAHLRYVGLPLVGDSLYGGPPLLLSRLKRSYRLKEGRTERPLIERSALHAEQVALPHPVTTEPLTIRAPWPKDLAVALKYLRRYAMPLS